MGLRRAGMRWPWRRRPPEAPRGVRVVLDDGTEVPVECVYFGRQSNRRHLWVVITPLSFHRAVRLNIEHLPSRTDVGMPAGRYSLNS